MNENYEFRDGDACPKCEKPLVRKEGMMFLSEVGMIPGIVCEPCNALWPSREFQKALIRRATARDINETTK